jgi:hypothetical protein
VRALASTLIGARAERREVSFASSAVFAGESLRDQLNRTSTAAAVTLRHELTPLTSVTMDVARVQDRFDFQPLRDSDSTQVSLGLKFDPFALVQGSWQVGFRQFTPRAGDVPDYRGITASANLGYVALGSTKLGLQLRRDVEYSFDLGQPYYLLTSLQASVAQQIYGPLDVETRFGVQRLAYRDRAGAQVEASERVDRGRLWGVGAGYRLGEDLRVGVNADWSRRRSQVAGRQYHALKVGTAVTYDF